MPRAGDTILEPSVELSGTVSDDQHQLEVLEYALDPAGDWTRIATSQQGNFLEKVALPTLDFRPLAIFLRSRDSQGAVGELEVPLTVDSVAPTCAFLSPTEGERIPIQPTGLLSIQLRAADGSARLEVALTANGETLPLMPLENAVFLAQLPLGATNAQSLTLEMSAVDTAGHACSQSIHVEVDQLAPTVSIDAPQEGALFNAKSPFARFSGSVSDHGASVVVELDFDDGEEMYPAFIADGGWQVDVPLPAQDLREHHVLVVATDAAGNTASDARTVQVDTLAPRISGQTPADGTRLNASHFATNEAILFGWKITEATAITQYVVQNDSTLELPLAPDRRTWPWRTMPTDNGVSYSLLVSARDASGNSASSRWSVLVDRVPPTVKRIHPPDGTRFFAGAAEVEASEPIQKGDAMLRIEPSATATWAPNSVTFGPLEPDAPHLLTVPQGSLRDLAGNPLALAASSSFRTGVARPDAGRLPITGFTQFDAIHDQTGAVTLALGGATSGTFKSTHTLVRLDPKTAEPVVEASLLTTGTLHAVQAHASSRGLADGGTWRIRGLSRTTNEGGRLEGRGTWKSDTSNGQKDGRLLLTREPCQTYGWDTPGWYDGPLFYRGISRAGAGDLSFAPQYVLPGSNEFWVGVGFDGGTVLQQGVRVTCGNFSNTWKPDPPLALPTASSAQALRDTWSAVALESGVVIHSYFDGTQLQERCIDPPACDTCAPVVTSRTSTTLVEARLALTEDGGVFRYERLASGDLQLRYRVNGSCTSGWLPNADKSLPAGSVDEYRAVRIGGVPAVLMSAPSPNGGHDLYIDY